MSNRIDLGEDSGRVEVTIGPQTVSIDVYSAYQEILEGAELPPREFAARSVAILERSGFAQPSAWAAERFADAVLDRVKELKKNAAGPSASPASPASTTAASSA